MLKQMRKGPVKPLTNVLSTVPIKSCTFYLNISEISSIGSSQKLH